jgi:hypothetical protein
MKPRHPYWYVRQRRFLSDADLAEIRAAEPDYLTASFVWERGHSHTCRLYLYDSDSGTYERIAEGSGPSAIEAFRAACERIEVLPSYAEWNGCQVEVVDGAA